MVSWSERYFVLGFSASHSIQYCEKFHQVDTKNYINFSKTTKTTYCLSTFRLRIFTRAEKTRAAIICNKSAITVHVCNENHVMDWENARQSRQSWQTHKGGDMDQEDRQHESRRGELPVEPRMGQAFTYWRPAPEVSPNEGFRREAETSINSTLFWLF